MKKSKEMKLDELWLELEREPSHLEEFLENLDEYVVVEEKDNES